MRRTRLERWTAVLAGGALTAVGCLVGTGSPASAATNDCGARTTTKAFAAWGDTNDYFPISNGTFETGTLADFTVTGSPWVTTENEPWKVIGGTRSVALPPAATLTATFCVQIGEESLRLFAKSPGGSGNALSIKSTVSTEYGSASSGISLSTGTAGWAPTSALPLRNVAGPDGRQYVTIVIKNNGTGTWLVDDILVDPWRTL